MLSGGGGGLSELPEQDADLALTALTDTFACLAAAGDEAAAYFYGWLFTTNPELRDLFPPAMDTQRDRFFLALTRIAAGMSRSAELATYVAQLGVDHRKYLVRPAMYPPVGDALIATLRAYAGPAFTPHAERAWMSAFEAVARLMIKAVPGGWVSTALVDHTRVGDTILLGPSAGSMSLGRAGRLRRGGGAQPTARLAVLRRATRS